MGGWGLKLFQSDHDNTHVQELTNEAGLDKLEKQHAAASNGEEYVWGDRPGGTDEDKDIAYVMIGEVCTDIDVVRKHMDSGVLLRMIANWEFKMTNERTATDWPNPAYMYVLLGACAMSIGCTLPQTFKDRLRETFKTVGLMRDALKQVDKSLNDPVEGFRDGTPFDFEFKGRKPIFRDGGPPREDKLYPNSMMINTPMPFGMPALSDASFREIRDNVISKRYGNGSWKQLFDAVLQEFPAVPMELYAVEELKNNMLFNTYLGPIAIVYSKQVQGQNGVRIVPQMPPDYMAELKSQLINIVMVAETMIPSLPVNVLPPDPPSGEQVAAAWAAASLGTPHSDMAQGYFESLEALATRTRCAECAATQCEDGSPLLRCLGGCKDTLYCSKKCQRIDRPAHKRTCRAKKV